MRKRVISEDRIIHAYGKFLRLVFICFLRTDFKPKIAWTQTAKIYLHVVQLDEFPAFENGKIDLTETSTAQAAIPLKLSKRKERVHF